MNARLNHGESNSIMIDPDDLTIEPNDDDIADEYWACDEDEPTEDFEVPEDLETHQL
jgi:hypothetical protein